MENKYIEMTPELIAALAEADKRVDEAHNDMTTRTYTDERRWGHQQ